MFKLFFNRLINAFVVMSLNSPHVLVKNQVKIMENNLMFSSLNMVKSSRNAKFINIFKKLSLSFVSS